MTKYKKTVTFFLFPEGQMRLFSFLYYGFVYSILQIKFHVFDKNITDTLIFNFAHTINSKWSMA